MFAGMKNMPSRKLPSLFPVDSRTFDWTSVFKFSIFFRSSSHTSCCKFCLGKSFWFDRDLIKHDCWFPMEPQMFVYVLCTQLQVPSSVEKGWSHLQKMFHVPGTFHNHRPTCIHVPHIPLLPSQLVRSPTDNSDKLGLKTGIIGSFLHCPFTWQYRESHLKMAI